MQNMKLQHATIGGELTQVSTGQPFMEFLPIMINKVGVFTVLEAIGGMLELSRYL